MAFNPIPPDPSNPAGYTWLEEHPATPPPEPQLPQAIQDAFASIARAFSDPNNQRTMIIVAALVAPLGLALCVVGFVAAYVRRKRQREQKQAGTSADGSKASKRPGTAFQPAPDTTVHYMQPHETGYGSVCGVNQPAMLPPSCESSADGGAGPVAPRGVFNTLRSSLTGMASGVASAIGLHRGASGDAYKIHEPRQGVPAGLLRGPSLDLQWPPTLRHREPTLPGCRKSLDAPVRPQPGAAVLSRAPAGGPVAARLGNSAALQPAQQQRQQQDAASFWMPEEQQGPSAMWGTPDMQAARGGSVYNNPLAQSQSGGGGGSAAGAAPSGADGFFLSGGDTFLMPTELTLADTLRVSQEPPAAVSRPWQRQQPQPSQQADSSSRSRVAPRGAPNTNWQ